VSLLTSAATPGAKETDPAPANLSPGCVFKKLLFPAVIIVLSLFALVILNFRGSDHVLLRRVASIANPNDFSWRNRVASWEGALQMIADKPLLGHGWGATESRYEAFYKPAKLDTGAAIQMNDYLTLGASLGLLALAAFIGLIIRLVPAGLRPEHGRAAPLQLAFTGAAIVLAIAFWFDGGLFKLSLAAVFWICFRLCYLRALL
jgi:O-antigen ligase